MKILEIDFETRSRVQIGGATGVGLYNYATHPWTHVLMMGYKLPGSDLVQLWEPDLDLMPMSVKTALEDPAVTLMAFNSAFERYVLKYKLGYDIPIERFIDPQVACRYLSIPPDLATCCDVLGLPDHLKKDKRGEDLITLFCEPIPVRVSKKSPFPEITFNDRKSHPAEWDIFRQYCMQDIKAESEVLRRCELLEAWPMSDFERKVWIFDQKVNDRGMPVDLVFVDNALALAERAKEEALKEQNAITGLANSNSRDQLLPWAKARGYTYNTLNKVFVEAALGDSDMHLTPECRTVLERRLSAASTSYTKLKAIRRHVCADNLLRNQFIYLGSSRCGRWSGNAVQLHNLPRPSHPKKVNGADFEDIETLSAARHMVYSMDYEGIKNTYGNVLEVIKSLIRSSFVAPGAQWLKN
jgi:DNA polymerase